MLLLNKKYTGILSSIEKDGRGFTSGSGTKYINYKVSFEGIITTYPLALRDNMILAPGDRITFILKLDKKRKIRAYYQETLSYDIKFPLRTEPVLD
jgi:hypothetical protein